MSLLRQAPRLTLAIMALPVAAGAGMTFATALTDGGAGVRALAEWPGLWPAARLSLTTGIAATALSLGLVVLVLAALEGTRAFRILQHLLSPLLSVPHAAAALALAFLIAPSGWIARALSPWATGWQTPPDLLILNDPWGLSLTAGLVAKEVPFLLLMALAALPQADAARGRLVVASLGHAPTSGFVLVILPALYRQLRLPVYAVLAYSMTTVEMAMILGPTRPVTLSAQVALWMADPDLAHRGTAAAGAVLQLALVILAILVWRGAEVLAARAGCRLAMTGWRGHGSDAVARPVALGLAGAMTGALILGLAGLALWSVAGLWQFPDALPENLTLRTWAGAAPDLLSAGAMTLGLGLLSTVAALALVLACLQAEHRFGLTAGTRALWLLYLPLIVPQIAFLPGLQIMSFSLGAGDGWPAVAAAHLVFVLPYVFLSLAPPWRAMDPRLPLAGAALGAAPGRVFWRLRLPILLRPVLTAAAVGFAVSVGQYLPTLLIGGGRVETLTTEAVALSSGGNRRIIGAYAFLQMALPALAFGLALAVPAIVFRNRRALWSVSA